MKILIIDDDIIFLESVKALLSAEGFSVQGAGNGTRGIKIAEKWLPDIIVLDLVLPDIDGLQMLSDIRDHDVINKIPVIVCTNKELKEKSDKCYSLGAKKVLIKIKYTPNQLIELIKKAAKEATQK